MVTIQEYHFAESLEDAADLLAENRRNTIIAGGMWLRMGNKNIRTAIDLSRLELNKTEITEETIAIGAMTTLRQMETDACLKTEFGGVLAKCVENIVGTQFRNMATVGASVYGRFGFSDIITALLALDADVALYRAGRISLAEFLANPPKRDILVKIIIQRDRRRASYQTLRRAQTDFGVLNLCLSERDGSYAVSIGARPGIAVRCPEAEGLLQAGAFDAAVKAVSALPYGSNLRGSAQCRSDMAAVLLRRAYDELREVKA